MLSKITDPLSRGTTTLRKFWRRYTLRWLTWRATAHAPNEQDCLAALAAGEPRARWQAAAVLGGHPMRSPDAIAALLQALADPEPFVRWQVIEALAAQETGRVFPALTHSLTDPDSLRRAGAAEALGRLGGEAAAQALRPHVTDPAPAVRAAVAAALGLLADPTAGPILRPLLADADPEVVCAAARALGRVGDVTAAVALAEVLARPAQPLLVRRALTAALARIPHPDAQPQLLVALADPDPQVRGYAARALGHIGNEAASAPLEALKSDANRLIRGTVGDRAARALALLERRGRHGTSAAARPTEEG